MRRFEFRFEKLLWHRSLQEELAEQTLSRSLNEERQVAEAIVQVRTQAAMGAARLRDELSGPIGGERLALLWSYQAGLGAREIALRARRSLVAARVAEDRTTLRERRRRREVVTQLKRKAEDRYRLEAEREAQKILDDVAGGRYLRQQRDGST
jgi:flagellar export protein FliJ